MRQPLPADLDTQKDTARSTPTTTGVRIVAKNKPKTMVTNMATKNAIARGPVVTEAVHTDQAFRPESVDIFSTTPRVLRAAGGRP